MSTVTFVKPGYELLPGAADKLAKLASCDPIVGCAYGDEEAEGLRIFVAPFDHALFDASPFDPAAIVVTEEALKAAGEPTLAKLSVAFLPLHLPEVVCKRQS